MLMLKLKSKIKMGEKLKIHKTNLATALSVAINAQRDYEQEHLNYDIDSALIAGWVEVLEAIKNGEEIELV